MGTYVLTGSASGIGAATRSRLEADGHRVIGVDLRNAEVVADLATTEGRAAALAQVKAFCGGSLDGLVPCAGVSVPVPAELTLQVNWFGTEVFLSGLREELAAGDEVSRVVAVSSNSTSITPNVPEAAVRALLDMDYATARDLCGEGLIGSAVAYATSKTAVARWVRQQAPSAQWAGAGIRLNAIAPGPVQTPLLQAGIDDPEAGQMIEGLPMPTGEFGSAELIAEWITFMLGPAADFMVGSLVFVDGGLDAMIRPDAWPQSYEI